MPVIRKLSPEIIGQIAAGEVVERPASAVKELVENSIDAGAKNITVELRDGGIKYLRITDNGRGIPPEQIRMAFERHATSKIVEAKDLFDIRTLGFRGEALASIAAVAKVTCTTRTQAADFGTRAVVEAGEFTDIRQAASPVGTTIIVEDLFYNTPVRLKFLKKPALEASMVADYMLRLILSRPDISFRFVNQGKTVYHSIGDGKLQSALFCLYGRDAMKQLQKVEGHMNGVLLSGYVGTGELARGNRQQQSFFINGRYFRSALLSRALEKGCEGRVMVGRFPMCALCLEMPYQQVDVNVHPNKLEVRFQNEMAVAAAVETLVRDAMHGDSLGSRLTRTDRPQSEPAKPDFTIVKLAQEEEMTQQPQVVPTAQTPAAPAAQQEHAAGRPVLSQTDQQALQALKPVVVGTGAASALHEQHAPERIARLAVEHAVSAARQPSPVPVTADPPTPKPIPKTSAARPTPPPAEAAPVVQATSCEAAPVDVQAPQPTSPSNDQPPVPEQTVLPGLEASAPQLRLVGIVFDTYWIFESGDKLLLVDQHAAHERILYDRMMARFEGETISQKLLSPQLVRLTALEMAQARELFSVLAQAGFEVEAFDDACVAVHAIPTLFGVNESPRELLLEALAELQAGRGQVTRERMRLRVAQMACKRAIKGGDRLSPKEIEGFMQEMLASSSMPTCPHGRPIVTEVTRYALEKRFKRIQ